MKKEFIGELLGTFILVLIGCSSVAVNVLYGWLNLYQIATIWMIGVALGIHASRKLCGSQLNPAVTIGFIAYGDFDRTKIIPAILGQFTGAFLAAMVLYLYFSSDIQAFESVQEIVRGGPESKVSAMMFGEFFPNPGNADLNALSMGSAMLLEGLGTFLLMTGILFLIRIRKIPVWLLPFLIGAVVAILIIFIAPYTQAGFNPARDFAPRLFSSFAGWKSAALPLHEGWWLTVYMLSPVLGAVLSGFIFRFILPKKEA